MASKGTKMTCTAGKLEGLAVGAAVVAAVFSVVQSMAARDEANSAMKGVATLEEQVKQQKEQHRELLEAEQMPFIAFETSASFTLRKREDGLWVHDPPDRNESRDHLPRVRNFGRGPAFDLQVEWQPSDKESLEATVEHQHLFPGESSRVFSCPAIFPPDTEHWTETGEVEITYRSLDGNNRTVRQSYRIIFADGEERAFVKFPKLLSLPYDHRWWG